MTVNEIRAQLEQFAATGANTEQLDYVTRRWLEIQGSTPQSHHPVVVDRINALGTTGNIHLALESVGDNCISALSLVWGAVELQMREVITPSEEFNNFVNDCIGWEDGEPRTATQRFEAGFGVVVTMSAENWQSWLETCEVAGMDEETAALLAIC